MITDDTITAIATPVGSGGVGIIRISGDKAIQIASRVFNSARGLSLNESVNNSFYYGYIYDDKGSKIDNGIALVMKNPRSYTGEDTVELQCHGSTVILKQVLSSILNAGARLAEPGEFSRRAFLNGRMDLTQAEGLYDLIRAKSDQAAKAALEQLDGVLKNKFNNLYDNLLEVIANLETTLDFVEDELPDEVFKDIILKIDNEVKEMDELLESWNDGHLLREGLQIVILGRPNVGKSTLLNAFLGFDRAIVSDVPGTTRDSIEEQLILSGIPLRVIDTAGLRKTNCSIESKGIERAKKYGEMADLIIYMLDASTKISEEDISRLSEIPKNKLIVLLNKIDLGRHIENIEGIEISLKNETDLTKLKNAITDKIFLRKDSVSGAFISERHRNLLLKSINEAKKSREYLNKNIEKHIVESCEHLRCSLEYLGQITGRVYHDELLDNIFSRFCIGK